MDISYLGHSCFKLKGKAGTVVCDPYESAVGFDLPTISADVVTISHDHFDHSAHSKVKGTARRKKPFIIDAPGEYEVGGISVFGVLTFHDSSKGSERGRNTVFTIMLDQVRVCHLGDLGHELSDSTVSQIGTVDVLLIPVGGNYTIDAAQATRIISSLEPGIAIPMHYRTTEHEAKAFADVGTVEDFLKEYGVSKKPLASLSVEAGKLPDETEVVVLEKTRG